MSIDPRDVNALQAAIADAEKLMAADTDHPNYAVVYNREVCAIIHAADKLIRSTRTADFREVPMSPGTEWLRVAATVEKIGAILPMYRGAMHGDDANGVLDVEFPDAANALSFMSASDGWPVKLRDAITDPWAPCVVQVQLDGYPADMPSPEWHPADGQSGPGPSTKVWEYRSGDTVLARVERESDAQYWAACGATGEILSVSLPTDRATAMRAAEKHAVSVARGEAAPGA